VLETAQQFQHQMADAPVAPVRSKVVTPAPSAPATPAVREPALVLPTSLQRLTKEQERSVAPPTPPKNYTLQVQTMGRNQRATIDDLVKDLRASGHEAFPNYDTGAVYVGRLESTRSQEAKRLKDSISRFNWRNRDFSSAFFIRIPSRLLEN
jgi:cell division septation protein DedD